MSPGEAARLAAWRGSVEERAALAWELAGIPARLRDCRLGSSPLGEGPMAGLVQRMTAPPGAGSEFWRQSWYLWGPVGVGKTGLAVGYAYQFVDPAYGEPGSVAFWTVPDLLSAFRAGYGRRQGGGSEAEILNACRDADLLVLDDLGTEHISGSGWAADRLFQVIGWRHGNDLATVFTSNLSPMELSERMGGVVGERLVWRMVELCGESRVVKVTGPNLREARLGCRCEGRVSTDRPDEGGRAGAVTVESA